MIKKHRPQGATHWQAGEYYLKTTDGVWYAYKSGVWILTHPENTWTMTPLRD
jgi:hypothetical protein